MFQNKKSITLQQNNTSTFVNANTLTVPFNSMNTFSTIQTTNTYNEHYGQIFSSLNERRQALQATVDTLPAGDVSYRNQGVTLAWKYEQAEIEMGGKGSGNWTNGQRQEILEGGKVRGAEGHHINSVGEHPTEQANPDNIKFVKNRQEHLTEHGGDFRNPTEGELVDRNSRLEDVNNKRVFKNELTGIGLAAAIGLGIGFTIGAVTTLAQLGISQQSIVQAGQVGLKTGAESSALAVINYGIIRGIGETATAALTTFATEKWGLILTKNLVKVCNMAVVGTISSIVFSSWLFIKMKWQGSSTAIALRQASTTLGMSLGILFISIVAQGLWGGYAGIIVSVCIGLGMILYQYVKARLDKSLYEGIQYFMIERLQPRFQV